MARIQSKKVPVQKAESWPGVCCWVLQIKPRAECWDLEAGGYTERFL